MNLDTIRERLDFERRTLARDGQVIEMLPPVTRSRSTDGSRHAVEYSALSAMDADAVISEQCAHYMTLGVEFEWTLCAHDQPADLIDRLLRHGFEIGPREAVVVLDLNARPAWIDDASRYEVLPVTHRVQLDVYGRVEQAIFPNSGPYVVNQLARSICEASWRQLGYIAYVDGIGRRASVGSRLIPTAGSAACMEAERSSDFAVADCTAPSSRCGRGGLWNWAFAT